MSSESGCQTRETHGLGLSGTMLEQERTAGGGIQIRVNGEVRSAPDGLTLAQFVESLGLEGSRLAIEFNRQIVQRHLWNETRLHEGAELEIVHFVGGG
jgi:thiamine biosynthesis protein ThiS